MEWVAWGYLVWVVLVSGVTLVVYGWDKFCASRGGRRVPERNLHGLALAGGWPGGWLGQRLFRHKTSKPQFLRIYWGTVAAHVLLVVGLVWLWWWLGSPSGQ